MILNAMYNLGGVLRLLGLILVATSLAAQTSTVGGITGTVRDPSSSTVPAAAVQPRNTSNGSQWQVLSRSTRIYRFARLSPGGYEISFEKDGFRKSVTQTGADILRRFLKSHLHSELNLAGSCSS
jgi:hypothetical protein